MQRLHMIQSLQRRASGIRGKEIEMPSTEYEAARQVAAEATQVYFAAAAKFRAGEISTSEYIAARDVYKASDVAFDAAFAAEVARAEA